jgi:hypothetical protein
VSSAEADSDLFRTRFPRTYVLGSVLASAKADSEISALRPVKRTLKSQHWVSRESRIAGFRAARRKPN